MDENDDIKRIMKEKQDIVIKVSKENVASLTNIFYNKRELFQIFSFNCICGTIRQNK